MTPQFVYEALSFNAPALKNLHAGAHPFTSIVTDSRKIVSGCLFVALKGDKFDGHDFIQNAIAAGARGILHHKDFKIAPQKDLCLFPVDDTQEAYRKLGGAWRREFSIPVIVVAGSVGKTTTKEILSAILRGRWPQVLRTQGSQNGYVGIPMTLLELKPEHGAAVIEVGIDEIGAMEKHMALVGAGASMLTAIAPEHLEYLQDIPTVAREEGIALSAVAQTGGLVVISLDDPWIRPHYSTLRTGRKIGYTLQSEGKAPSADVPGEIIRGSLSADGKTLSVSGLGSSPASFAMPLPGRHNAGNLLAAITLAHGLGLRSEEIQNGLKTFAGAEGRSELRELAGKTPVVCDYYNASPASMEAGFQMLADIASARGGATLHACLGDMLEMGKGEEALHRDLAASLMKLGVQHVYLYGPRMQWLHNELQNRGFAGSLSHHTSHDTLAESLLSKVRAGDAILIKGSRGMKMEEVWKRLQTAFKG